MYIGVIYQNIVIESDISLIPFWFLLKIKGLKIPLVYLFCMQNCMWWTNYNHCITTFRKDYAKSFFSPGIWKDLISTQNI